MEIAWWPDALSRNWQSITEFEGTSRSDGSQISKKFFHVDRLNIVLRSMRREGGLGGSLNGMEFTGGAMRLRVLGN